MIVVVVVVVVVLAASVAAVGGAVLAEDVVVVVFGDVLLTGTIPVAVQRRRGQGMSHFHSSCRPLWCQPFWMIQLTDQGERGWVGWSRKKRQWVVVQLLQTLSSGAGQEGRAEGWPLGSSTQEPVFPLSSQQESS